MTEAATWLIVGGLILLAVYLVGEALISSVHRHMTEIEKREKFEEAMNRWQR